MSASALTGMPSSAMRVVDDLYRESLPQTHRDPLRKVTWMNAVCASVLTVGILLTKKPAEMVFHPEVIDSTPMVIPEFVPDTNPQVPQPQEQVEESTDTPADAPVIAAVVVADPSKVSFAVPVVGPTTQAVDYRYVPPPPRVEQRAAPSRPSGPTEFKGGASNDGGSYPKPEYPRDSLIRRESGLVRLYVVVSEDGGPEKVEIREPSGFFGLDRAAVACVKRYWRWPAGPRREYIVPIDFTLH